MIAILLNPCFKTLAFSNCEYIFRIREMLIKEANKYMFNDIVFTSTYDIIQSVNNSQSDVNDERISFWSSFDIEIIAVHKNV